MTLLLFTEGRQEMVFSFSGIMTAQELQGPAPSPGLLPGDHLGYPGLATESCGSHTYRQPSEAASSSALRGLDDQRSDTGYGAVLLHES